MPDPVPVDGKCPYCTSELTEEEGWLDQCGHTYLPTKVVRCSNRMCREFARWERFERKPEDPMWWGDPPKDN